MAQLINIQNISDMLLEYMEDEIDEDKRPIFNFVTDKLTTKDKYILKGISSILDLIISGNPIEKTLVNIEFDNHYISDELLKEAMDSTSMKFTSELGCFDEKLYKEL